MDRPLIFIFTLSLWHERLRKTDQDGGSALFSYSSPASHAQRPAACYMLTQVVYKVNDPSYSALLAGTALLAGIAPHSIYQIQIALAARRPTRQRRRGQRS